MIERRTSAKIAQFCLHHRAQVPGSMVTEVDHLAELAFEKNDHASSDLGCWNCHYVF
jgi:hypothetical protein